MDTTQAPAEIRFDESTATLNRSGDRQIDRALERLAASGLTFEVVERCPTDCVFCGVFCDESVDAAVRVDAVVVEPVPVEAGVAA